MISAVLCVKMIHFGSIQDPSVQIAASGTTTTSKVDLDDYNPFDNKTTHSENPAVMNPTEEPAAVAKTASQPQVSTADLQVL